MEEPKLDKDAQLRASRFNDFAKVVYLVVVVGFNIVFWIVAMQEYMRPAEEYLDDGSFTEGATPLTKKTRTKTRFA